MKASHAIKTLSKQGFVPVESGNSSIAFLQKDSCRVAVFFNGAPENDKCASLQVYRAERGIRSGEMVNTMPQAFYCIEKYLSGKWA